jgi:hypothetical protein
MAPHPPVGNPHQPRGCGPIAAGRRMTLLAPSNIFENPDRGRRPFRGPTVEGPTRPVVSIHQGRGARPAAPGAPTGSRRPIGGPTTHQSFKIGVPDAPHAPSGLPGSHLGARPVGQIATSEPVSIGKTEPVALREPGTERSAQRATRLGTLQEARSEFERRMWRGVAQRGRAGRALALGEPGVRDRTTANSLVANRHGPPRMTRPSRRRSPREAACGFWVRAEGQRGSAVRGTGRLSRRARGRDRPKGGLDIPTAHAERDSRSRKHPCRTWARGASLRTGRISI